MPLGSLLGGLLELPVKQALGIGWARIIEACQRLMQDPVRADAVDAEAILAQVKSEVNSLARRCEVSPCCIGH